MECSRSLGTLLRFANGFGSLYVILYIYFSVSHSKTADPKKDQAFVMWSFLLAIACNMIIMVMCFIGIALTASVIFPKFSHDMKQNSNFKDQFGNQQDLIDKINLQFSSGALLSGANDNTPLNEFGLFLHQFDPMSSRADYPWEPCFSWSKHKKDMCSHLAPKQSFNLYSHTVGGVNVFGDLDVKVGDCT